MTIIEAGDGTLVFVLRDVEFRGYLDKLMKPGEGGAA